MTTAIEIAGCVVGICGGHHEDRFRIPSVRIESNLIYQIYGTKPGSGYGIHLSNVPGAVVAQNVVAYVQRHSIYVSFGNSGATTPVRLHGNIILVGDFPGAQWFFACTAIARSAHVLVTAHIDFGCRATALSIERAEEFAISSSLTTSPLSRASFIAHPTRATRASIPRRLLRRTAATRWTLASAAPRRQRCARQMPTAQQWTARKGCCHATELTSYGRRKRCSFE